MVTFLAGREHKLFRPLRLSYQIPKNRYPDPVEPPAFVPTSIATVTLLGGLFRTFLFRADRVQYILFANAPARFSVVIRDQGITGRARGWLTRSTRRHASTPA